MKRLAWLACAALVALALGGCAHPISLNPDLSGTVGSGASKIDKKVGLYVAEADKQRQVTTPGGGGDKVSYFPYRDLETGLYVALSESFASVSRLSGPADPKLRSEQLNFIVTPILQTTSFSDSILTWPPTQFSIELTCKVVNADGGAVAEVRVVGDGRASFDEFKGDFSLSAKRASEDLLKKLIKALGETAALR